ncbi:hypothetical protein X801_01436 [Opisthorchis viverrini]|uniref:Uncharacterized protein n=2 Tax=Opisthorchis viverrini TaxID=6198 RepID=A0A1S8X7F0_OPIVI|nr:hypothetical protein T265_07366 [Opisthorchis viverrini]KER25145.1 hypothetical protein T265_07366 [Opisthorchis viverrini]OON22665.1 hypothetical protein X801_01436 [Opisthorchis viverrini]
MNNVISKACKGRGEWCDGSLFNRCCGHLRCELKSFADGICRSCIGSGHACVRDSQCCSDDCQWLKCL